MKIIVKSKEPYVKQQPIFGHSKSQKHKKSKLDKWVNYLQNNISKF